MATADRHSRARVSSRLRKRGFDYASPATYFVTICSEGRVQRFGHVYDGSMELSHCGVMLDSWWWSIPLQFADVMLDSMLMMPDHLHAVLSTGTVTDSPVSSLGEVIRWFKSQTTRDYGVGVRTAGWSPYERRFWQQGQGYFDHIVRNDGELDRIRKYIETNPERWALRSVY